MSPRGVLKRAPIPNENICFDVDVFVGCCVGWSCDSERDMVDFRTDCALGIWLDVTERLLNSLGFIFSKSIVAILISNKLISNSNNEGATK